MNDMNTSNRDYDNRDYDYRDYDYRNYRGDYRDSDYRDYDYRDYRDDYRTRDYDRRGGKINNRDYRDYRDYRNYRNYHADYYEELEMAMEDMKETGRRLEDIADMSKNMNEKNMLMRVSQKEKEHYTTLKQMLDKGM